MLAQSLLGAFPGPQGQKKVTARRPINGVRFGSEEQLGVIVACEFIFLALTFQEIHGHKSAICSDNVIVLSVLAHEQGLQNAFIAYAGVWAEYSVFPEP